VKRQYIRIPGIIAGGVTLLTLCAGYALACSFVYLSPSLPSVGAMRRVELQVPLRVYSRNGGLIAQIGEQRRIPVTYEQIPLLVREAFVAAEDDQFFQHRGIDYLAVLRAAFVNLVSAEKAQGASTITQQAARNMFLTLDKTWHRKLAELFVTLRMEGEFSKQEILGLYLNVIFFGQRAYGVAAAAETYFGKSLDQLTVSELATLAGIPQAPSRFNPITNPEFAGARRAYVLRRMRVLGFIDEATAVTAAKEPVRARAHGPLFDIDAPYIAEMARLEIRTRFGAAAESAGYKVYTTIDGRLQTAANRAVRVGLIEYDRRHGWRGPAGRADIGSASRDAQFEELLGEYSGAGILSPAIVVSVAERSARVYVKARGFAQIGWDGLSWARSEERAGAAAAAAPKAASDVLAPGDVVYVVTDAKGAAQLAQIPEAQSALVALDPDDGSVAALVGGFDYYTNKYNRVTQARRLPGSGFKPFLYSAALENGFTPATVLLDAPIVLEGNGLETAWRPENSSGQFGGPTRLREALVRSRNLVSIRLLRAMGTDYSIDYITRFGFTKTELPNNLTLALGTLQTTPLELVTGYATFANGGFRVQPYFIDRIENAAGEIVWHAAPRIACDECTRAVHLSDLTLGGDPATALREADTLRGGHEFLPAERLAERVISPQNAYLMTDMMADVIRHGTGRRALALGRSDLAGKTGTTNEAKDTWFNGFTPHLVATVWVGFDQERSLGEAEEGAKTALPIWMHFKREALKGVPEHRRPMPDGLVTLRISPDTGVLASGENRDAVLETFMSDHLPAGSGPPDEGAPNANTEQTTAGEPLF
jgi:penicillin-binding protein 1A